MRFIIAALAVAVVSAGIGFVAGAQDAPAKPRFKTLKTNEVARVASEIITAEQLLGRISQFENAMHPTERILMRALNTIVMERLLEIESKRIDTRIKQREITAEADVLMAVEKKAFDRLNAEIAEEAKARGNKPQLYTWEEYLKVKRGLTVEVHRANLEKSAEAIIKIRLVVGFWEISNTHADAHGLMVSSKEKAEAIRKDIVSGKATLELKARLNNMDSKTRRNDGSIGTVWKGDGRIEAELDSVFWKLKVGEISEPIQTQRGWWLVRKTKEWLPNEQPLYEQREALMKAANIDDNRLLAWQNAVSNSERYAYERRLPGLDYSLETK
ncbi:MAG: peptidylprolyl isomerase [Planctomycetes bacterium]|nr:peptidylprolyl isomerase [Planctomycetota bacterium]